MGRTFSCAVRMVLSMATVSLNASNSCLASRVARVFARRTAHPRRRAGWPGAAPPPPPPLAPPARAARRPASRPAAPRPPPPPAAGLVGGAPPPAAAPHIAGVTQFLGLLPREIATGARREPRA